MRSAATARFPLYSASFARRRTIIRWEAARAANRPPAGTSAGCETSARDVSAELITDPPSLEEPDYSIRLALLAAIVESSDDAIVSKTLDGRILSWNAGASRIFGYTAEEVIGKPITIIIPPELHEEEQRILNQVRRGRRIEHFDTIRIAKDGRRVFISLTVSPVRDSRGVIIGASKVARDISERKHAEQALLDSERRLAAEAGALVKLNELSTRLWRSPGLNEGLDEILAAVIDLLGAEKGHIQLLDAAGSKLSIVAQRGFEPDFLEFLGEVSASDDSACSRALRSGQRILIEDVETDGPDAPFRVLARAAGYRSMISTPLMGADGTPLGMVSSHFRLIRRPTEQELRRLDLYLRQASDFIQRSWNYQVTTSRQRIPADVHSSSPRAFALMRFCWISDSRISMDTSSPRRSGRRRGAAGSSSLQ